MRLLVLIVALTSCASYTDPEQERVSFYKCSGGKTLAVKHSDDYERLAVKFNGNQYLLHHFVGETREGYSNEHLRWGTRGGMGFLAQLRDDGSEQLLFKNCKILK